MRLMSLFLSDDRLNCFDFYEILCMKFPALTCMKFSQLDEQDTAAQGIAGMRDLFLT